MRCVGAPPPTPVSGLQGALPVRDWCGTGAGPVRAFPDQREYATAGCVQGQSARPARRLCDAPSLSSAALVAQVSAATLAYINTDESGLDFQNKTRHQSPRRSS